MKVQILTQPLGHNYGGLLQAYAMQRHLTVLGCEVTTVNRRHVVKHVKRPLKERIKITAKKAIQFGIGQGTGSLLQRLETFRDTRLAMSPAIYSDAAMRRHFEADRPDAYVVGSDQVWRPKYSPGIGNFFLDFVDDAAPAPRRIAYSASFGVDAWEYSREETELCAPLAQKFDAVSVRETSAVALCRDHLGINAKATLDPTLLLDRAEYDTLIADCSGSAKDGEVVTYFLDASEQKKAVEAKVRDILGCRSFSILPEGPKVRLYPSVECWLKYVSTARFVVTDSFHGAVFSILFNRPFLVIGNRSRGLARFTSILTQFGLAHRLVEAPDAVTPALVEAPIDWEAVNARHGALKADSAAFLKDSLFPAASVP